MVLKSSKEVIAKFISDIDIDIADIEHRLFEWIDDALDIMDITKHYILKREVLEVENHKATLPCGLEFLHSIWSKSDCGELAYINITGSPFVHLRSHAYPMNGVIGSIENNELTTSFRRGKILIIYKAKPVDCDGYPMIPKSAKLDDALMYYILYRLALKGIPHPVVSFEMAYQQWTNLYVGAANDVEWFTLPELEEFSRMWGTIQLDSTTDNLYIN